MPQAVDYEALSSALRALGMLDGASRTLGAVAQDASDAAGAIRAYITRERPHLLSCYDMDTLVGLVLAKARGGADGEHPAALEQSHSL
jgi:hypothetical protein